MRRLILSLVTAVGLGLSAAGTASAASPHARHGHHHHTYRHGDRHHGHHHHGHYHHRPACATDYRVYYPRSEYYPRSVYYPYSVQYPRTYYPTVVAPGFYLQTRGISLGIGY